MARVTEIKSKVDLYGFIYDPGTLPTAIVRFREGTAFSVHSAREGGESHLDAVVKHTGSFDTVDDFFKGGKVAKAYPFFEDYPDQREYDIGMYKLPENFEVKFARIEEYATKSFDMCA